MQQDRMKRSSMDRERAQDMRSSSRQGTVDWRNERSGARGSREGRGSNGSRGNRTAGRALLIGAGIAAAAFGLMRANRRSSDMQRSQGQYRAPFTGDRGRAERHNSLEARRHTLLAWLNDAHAMEKSVEQTLKGHIADARRQPHIHARLEKHLDETRRHAEMVKERIQALGGSVSALKSGLSTAMGVVQGVASKPAKDSLVKDLLADSAAEQLEISSYKGIITAAELVGDSETAEIARDILRDEEEMLRWIEQQIPQAIRTEMAKA